jgi:PhnB protein
MLDDNAAMMRRAVDAGCEPVQPPTEMFYGANSASVRDPYGHVWVLLTWREDLSAAEMARRGAEANPPSPSWGGTDRRVSDDQGGGVR